MNNSAVRYTCVTCGICCKGRLIPLTIKEAEQWLIRGDEVAIILEAFSLPKLQDESPEFIHNSNRAATVDSGTQRVNVIAIFTANALKQCPNLQEDNLCGVYEARPLVCRIYPMEINPFIELREENKICPPESWGSGEILCSDGIANPPLQSLINQSRQADIKDAVTKVAICESLGMTVASWKGEGLAVYFPESDALLAAIRARNRDDSALSERWSIRTDNQNRRQQLAEAGIVLAPDNASNYIYQTL
ncbi:YkgJ family cysteine cluster protein (plasmid) [Pseudomonas sp. UBT]|uniref:YkgJ family cysteine cluster protein n=1 Tax=Pseudomonas sp. UBT TaxID=3239198 RepID=UPI003D8009CC